MFQDLDDPPVGATFGEVMCSTYKAFGSVGLITSGGGRDLLQVKALGYPVFSGSTICSHAYCQTLEVGVPVRVGGLTVQTGDLLHGDANGVTSIPLELASEVADVAEEFVAAENHVLEYVKASGAKEVGELAAKRGRNERSDGSAPTTRFSEESLMDPRLYITKSDYTHLAISHWNLAGMLGLVARSLGRDSDKRPLL